MFALAVWRWKKWGVYGFLGTTVVAMICNVAMGVALMTIALGLIGAVILVALVRPRWAHFS